MGINYYGLNIGETGNFKEGDWLIQIKALEDYCRPGDSNSRVE